VTAGADQPPGFDPRGTLPLALTGAALVAFFVWQVPALGAASEYPELRLQNPTKALLQQSLVERAAPQPPILAFLPPCQLCERAGVVRAWQELSTLFDLYGEDLPSGLRDARASLARAKEVSLASWGDAESLELVGNPAQAIREAPKLAGVHLVEPARARFVRSAWLWFDLIAVLGAVGAYVWPSTAATPPRVEHSASQGLCVFVWCMGAGAASYALLGDWAPWAWDWYPLLDMASALPIAAFALQRGSCRRLLQDLGLKVFSLAATLRYTILVLGIVVAYTWASTVLFGVTGYVEHWAPTAGDVLIYGSPADKLLRGVSLVVVGPIFEEALFTALLFGGLANRLSFRSAAVVTGVAFAAWHAYDLPGSLELVVSAVASCWAYSRTGSLWPSIFVHALLNAAHVSWAFY
jgi:membrane protease YdiL (CAAX protease family)